MKDLKDFVKIADRSPILKDKALFLEDLDGILYQAVFEKDENKRSVSLETIKEIPKAEGAIPSSIRQSLQGKEKRDRLKNSSFTVPGRRLSVP